MFSLFFLLVVAELASVIGVLYAAPRAARYDKISTPIVAWLIVWFGVMAYVICQALASETHVVDAYLLMQAFIATCAHIGAIFVGAKLTK